VPVITVSRQYGSGGSIIAGLVAERLGWNLVDNEFVDLVAARMNVPREEVAKREERPPSLIERLAASLAASSPETFFAAPATTGEHLTPEDEVHRLMQVIITEAVQHGDAVLVGRGAQFYLQNRDDVLHIFLAAPLAIRVQRVAERSGVSVKEAEKTVAGRDKGRREYVDTHYRRDWDDPANYHLIVNSGLLTYPEAADVIVAAARRTLG
jgi:cytidylate kinase